MSTAKSTGTCGTSSWAGNSRATLIAVVPEGDGRTMKLPAPPPRLCAWCNAPIVKRGSETNNQFNRRATCGGACGVAWGHHRRGRKAPIEPLPEQVAGPVTEFGPASFSAHNLIFRADLRRIDQRPGTHVYSESSAAWAVVGGGMG